MTTFIGRAMWSPRFSQRMTGYDQQGRFVTTPNLYTTCKENTYVTSEGEEFVVTSWAPDGRGYGREKKR